MKIEEIKIIFDIRKDSRGRYGMLIGKGGRKD
jgi:hypothetical protein